MKNSTTNRLQTDIAHLNPAVLPQWFLNLFPLFGLLTGLFIWFIDAVIDTYFLENNDSFLTCLLYEEPQEMWMRTLVVIVVTLFAFIAQLLLKRQKKIEILLRRHQLELESIVEERTHKLIKIASLDPLTEIYNRRKFSEVLDEQIQISRRYKNPLSLLLCDLDSFKNINDKYGHQMGDDVLIKFASIVKNNLRITDFYARWGGEEFIMLLPQTYLDEAKIVAEKIRITVSEFKFAETFHLTVSFGITIYYENENPESIIKRADDALYSAKATGRNRTVILE